MGSPFSLALSPGGEGSLYELVFQPSARMIVDIGQVQSIDSLGKIAAEDLAGLLNKDIQLCPIMKWKNIQ